MENKALPKRTTRHRLHEGSWYKLEKGKQDGVRHDDDTLIKSHYIQRAELYIFIKKGERSVQSSCRILIFPKVLSTYSSLWEGELILASENIGFDPQKDHDIPDNQPGG